MNVVNPPRQFEKSRGNKFLLYHLEEGNHVQVLFLFVSDYQQEQRVLLSWQGGSHRWSLQNKWLQDCCLGQRINPWPATTINTMTVSSFRILKVGERCGFVKALIASSQQPGILLIYPSNMHVLYDADESSCFEVQSGTATKWTLLDQTQPPFERSLKKKCQPNSYIHAICAKNACAESKWSQLKAWTSKDDNCKANIPSRQGMCSIQQKILCHLSAEKALYHFIAATVTNTRLYSDDDSPSCR